MGAVEGRLRLGLSCLPYSMTSTLTTSPASHSAQTSNGRQQTSQSVVKRWDGRPVSNTSSFACPQKGHWIVAASCIGTGYEWEAPKANTGAIRIDVPTGLFIFAPATRRSPFNQSSPSNSA